MGETRGDLTSRFYDQSPHAVRFEWGHEAVRRLAPVSDVVVIVDVLRFTTCVDAAVSRGALVFPYRYKDASARAFAASVRANLAGERDSSFSLSPLSMLAVPRGGRVVLPSPNGSACTVLAAETPATVIAGCLRNARAIAGFVDRRFPRAVVSVVACGELWPDGSLRPAVEDLLGAGAILSGFAQDGLSPEARAAVAAFRALEQDLAAALAAASSGRELFHKGHADDVSYASALHVSDCVPILRGGAFVDAADQAEKMTNRDHSEP